jgi:hypothetical protein
VNPSLKVFELDEANALLPKLEALLAELEEKQEEFRRLQEGLFFEELLDEASPPEEKLQDLERVLLRLEEEITEIRRLGCLLRHPERGLVDFLARRSGEWVYYCWRRGEKEIQYYHTLRGGFLERQSLYAGTS